MKKALITGITGQDGSYLADLLLEKGYEVHGIIRRASTFNTSRIDHLYADPHVNDVRMFLHYGDLSDSVNLVKLLYKLKPDEIYHLGAQSHVRVSFDIPEYTSDVTGVGTIRILEAIREAGLRSRFLQASSTAIFGRAQEVPQNENTPFWRRSGFDGAALVEAYMDWKPLVTHDRRNERAADVYVVLGEAQKAKEILRWEPKVRFRERASIMVDADMNLLSRTTAKKHLGKVP